MPKYETLEKLCHLDDGENRWKTSPEMAIELIYEIIKTFPEKFYYIGQMSINANDFARTLPRDQEIEEYALENLLQDDHGPLTHRKINGKVDSKKTQYGLLHYITIYRADTEKELRDAEKMILEPFITKRHCLNENKRSSDMTANPFHHGYVYFAYDGAPLHPHWLRGVLSGMELIRRGRAKSIDQMSIDRLSKDQYLYGNLYELQRSFKNLNIRDTSTMMPQLQSASTKMGYQMLPTNLRDKSSQTEHIGILYRLPNISYSQRYS